MSVENSAFGLVNLLKRVSQADSLCRGSFVDDSGPAKDKKNGTMSRLYFSASAEASPSAKRS